MHHLGCFQLEPVELQLLQQRLALQREERYIEKFMQELQAESVPKAGLPPTNLRVKQVLKNISEEIFLSVTKQADEIVTSAASALGRGKFSTKSAIWSRVT